VENSEMHPYYASRKPEIIASFEEALRASATLFDRLVPQHPIDQVKPLVLVELDRMLLTLPYVGGETGRMTPFFEQAAGFFALGRVLRRLGVSMEVTASLMRQTFLSRLLGISQIQRLELGRQWLSEDNKAYLRIAALASDAGKTTGDFVYQFVEPGQIESGQSFEFGLDYSECGFCKLCKANGDEELLPVMCAIDKEIYAIRGVELFRSMTLASGATHCDFRFRRLAEPNSEQAPVGKCATGREDTNKGGVAI